MFHMKQTARRGGGGVSDRYQRNAERRRTQNERRLMGETLEQFHARETAPPPTLAEIYRENHKNRERCVATIDLFEKPKRRRRHAR